MYREVLIHWRQIKRRSGAKRPHLPDKHYSNSGKNPSSVKFEHNRSIRPENISITHTRTSPSRLISEGRYNMATAGDTQLFDESFTITTEDHAKYDRVGRYGATSADHQTVMTLDINTELYPCQVGETLHCVLASSLSLDGTKDDGKGWRDVGRNVDGAEPTLADMFDYVCHGKIYKFEDGEDGQTM